MKKTWMRITAFILLMLFFVGCDSQKHEEALADEEGNYVLTSEEMDNETKTQLDTIQKAFEKALAERNAEGIMQFVDEGFNTTQGTITSFLEASTPEGRKPYVLYDSYYLNGLTVAETMIRAKKTKEDQNYIMFTPGSEQLYAAMYVSENKDVSQMISLLCAKQENTWKIVWIDTSDFTYAGKDAPAYYTLAKEAKKAGNDMLAYIYAQMMYNIYQPANLLYYKDSTPMMDFIMERNDWGKKNIPITLQDGKKKIHTVGIAREKEGVVPMIFYQTQSNIKDAALLKKEAQSVRDEFLKKYKGIADQFPVLTVRATNVDPSTATQQIDYESVVLPMK